ncbi:hypothetical protein HYW20_03065 [Candidatus Woesearchaeota archaeon]|nr:hypothetical protein [Candidatus Woesearchaeota archaeon]
MKKLILQPHQLIAPGEYELHNESILKIYFRIFDRGHGKDLPPAIVTGSATEKIYDKFLRQYERDVADLKQNRERLNTVVGRLNRDSEGKYYTDDDQVHEQLLQIGIGTRYKMTFPTKYYVVEGELDHDLKMISARLAHSQKMLGDELQDYQGIRDKAVNLMTTGANYILLDGNHKTAAATLTHNPIHALQLETDDDLAEVRRMVTRGELFDFKRPETSLDELVNAFYEYCKNHIDEFNTVRERIDKLTSNHEKEIFKWQVNF